jgi:uncharacterized linocin/CFP29 family protein
MNHLLRPLAPISDEAWEQIENEAQRALRAFLAARRLVDFSGPHGWEHSALGLGRVDPAAPGPAAEVESRLRRAQPLVELRTPFRVARAELDAADRGAPDADWDVVIEAARRAALAEDRLVFQGFPPAAVKGMIAASPHPAITISEDYHRYPNHVAQAVETLRRAGVGGPYAIALGPRCYTGVIESTEHGGYPVLEHLRLIAGGPVVWAPAVEGAVVVSQRGEDFELIVGQDLSIGYTDHDADSVGLYLEESITFRAAEPEAAVALAYADEVPKPRARRRTSGAR